MQIKDNNLKVAENNNNNSQPNKNAKLAMIGSNNHHKVGTIFLKRFDEELSSNHAKQH